VSWNEEPWSWEPTQDILDYLGFAGVETTRDQLARLHRRRLIGEPFHDQNGGRSSLARYRRYGGADASNLAIAFGTKQLDELAWRLWWEGFDVEPDLIRTYLLKRATRWDEQLREMRMVAVTSRKTTRVSATCWRGLLRALEGGSGDGVGAKTSRARVRTLRRVFGLLIDLMHGDLSSLDRIDAGLFERDATSADHVLVEESRRAGEVALAAMQASMDTPFIQLSPRWMIRRSPTPGRCPASTGTDFQRRQHRARGFGGSGHGRDNVGKSLITMAENSEDQVLALLLTSSFLKDDRVREALPEMTPVPTTPAAISFLDFLRLRYLAMRFRASWCCWHRRWFEKHSRHPRAPSAGTRGLTSIAEPLLRTTRGDGPSPGLVRRRTTRTGRRNQN